MAKNVFKNYELKMMPQKIYIRPPEIKTVEAPKVEEVEEYTGPTVDDIKREAEEFRQDWEKRKLVLISEARGEAERIVKDAEAVAFEEVKNKSNQAQRTKQDAELEAKRIVSEAERKAAEMERAVAEKLAAVEKDAVDRGFQEGNEKGFREGALEVQRLTDRLHVILNKAIEKRNEIIEESETQLINLVLLISKKVIKVISENQKNVVINNVVQALRKLKSRGDVVIRVNLSDLELTTQHVNDFMRMVENVKSVTVLEDSSVDRGGCLIETDFGQIDARVSSQLHEIEEKIMELAPIKAKGDQTTV